MTTMLAETATAATVTSALTGGITTIAGEMMNAVAAVVPVALPILGAVMIVSVGIRLFKKITGR